MVPDLGHMPLVARLLVGLKADELREIAATAIDLIDHADGDPDDEPNGDDELTGDEADSSYIEWATKPGNFRLRGGPEVLAGHEDDEDNGDHADGQFGEDEECARFARMNAGPGCIVSDSDVEHDGREYGDGDY